MHNYLMGAVWEPWKFESETIFVMWSSKMSRNSQNTLFKIQPNKAISFFCFLFFVQSFNCLYLWKQLPNLCGVFTKLKPKQYPNRKCQKNKTKQKQKQKKNHIFQLQTYSFCLITPHLGSRICSHEICNYFLVILMFLKNHSHPS